LRDTGWILKVSFSVLSDWDKGFDENMVPLTIPDKRGKAARITPEMVRIIVRAAEGLKARGRRLRLKGFTAQLREEHDISLSRRKVQQVLVANDLFAVRTRKRRPRFYQSLRKEIPNGLLSLDGSEIIVWVDGEPYTFNVELGVDVKTFAHTAFWVGDSETSEGVLRVLEAHRKDWGTPLGMLSDSGSANLSERTRGYLRDHGIELVPAGPANPKGNGTDEGAFSQLKRFLGTIRLDLSSQRSLAKSVLEKLISLYIAMRNRIPLRRNIVTPQKMMGIPAPRSQQDLERKHLKDHNARKAESADDQIKVDQLHALIRYHRMEVEAAALKQAERSIKAFQREAIRAAEEAFIKAVNRKAERKNLPYFFGILRRIQQERDDEAYRHYCRHMYNEKVMTQLHRESQQAQNIHTVEGIVGMLVHAVKETIYFVKELALKKAHQWTQELMKTYRYSGALMNRFFEALDNINDLTFDQRAKAIELIEQLFTTKIKPESVTWIL
jgi:hypothetical protein